MSMMALLLVACAGTYNQHLEFTTLDKRRCKFPIDLVTNIVYTTSGQNHTSQLPPIICLSM